MSRVERNLENYSAEDRRKIERARNASQENSRVITDPKQADNSAEDGAKRVVTKPDDAESAARVVTKHDDAKSAARTDKVKKKKRKGSFLGKFIGFIGTIILILSIVACLGLSIPRFVGIDQYVVISGSMEPAIPVGSMVYSAQTEPSTLEPGDVIVFYSREGSDTPITHRVVENHISDGEVITKGDANAQNDMAPVMYTNILGKMVLHIPTLGYIAAPMASIMGKVAMGLVMVAAYLLTVVGSRMNRS